MRHLSFIRCIPLCLLFALPGLSGQNNGTLHLIASIDNLNEDLMKGCEKDFAKAGDLFKAIAEDAGMAFEPHQLSFNRDEVEAFISGFQCNPNDLVIFLYSGHGFRYEDDGEEMRWPYLYYCNADEGQEKESCELDLDWVQNTLTSKSPRMTITIGDCCNNVLDNEEANAELANGAQEPEESEDFENTDFKKLDLITRFHGDIIATACSPGQGSYTNNDDGSYFVNALFGAMYDALTAGTATTWKGILDKTRAEVQREKPGQTPQYYIMPR